MHTAMAVTIRRVAQLRLGFAISFSPQQEKAFLKEEMRIFRAYKYYNFVTSTPDLAGKLHLAARGCQEVYWFLPVLPQEVGRQFNVSIVNLPAFRKSIHHRGVSR